ANNIPWQPVEGQPGAALRELGTFSERGIRLFSVKVEAGATYALPQLPQEQILFFTRGAGKLSSGETWAPQTAAQLEAQEAPTLRATAETEALVLVLPRF